MNYEPKVMRRIALLLPIVILLCSCKPSATASDGDLQGAAAASGSLSSSQQQDIYTTGTIDTLMMDSKYFGFKRKVFVYLPPSYPYYDSRDYDVVYTTDAQTMQEFFMVCSWPLFQERYKWFIVVGICSPQTEEYSRQDDFLPNDSATISSYDGHGGHSGDLMKFVGEELMPYIHSHYRVTARSLGIGHSLGASFMMQSLMDSDPFTDYFFLSPNMTFGRDKLLLASRFCHYTFDANKRRFLFFSDAGEERFGWASWKPAREMVYRHLDAGQLPRNVVWRRKSYPDYGHLTSLPQALRDAYHSYFEYIDSIGSLASRDIAMLSEETYRKHIEIVVKDARQDVCIAGNQRALGMWNPCMVKLEHVNDSVRSIDVDLHLPAMFKFTLGSWDYECCLDNAEDGETLQINSTERTTYRYNLNEWVGTSDDANP